MDFTVFSQVTCDEKEKLRNEVWNVILDKKRYKQVMQFRNDNAAIKNMRKNIDSRFCSHDKNVVWNTDIILPDSLKEDFFCQTVNLNEYIVSAIIAVRPEYSNKSIRGAVTKTQKTVKNNEIVFDFVCNQLLVIRDLLKVPHPSNHVQFHYMGRVTYAVKRIAIVSKRWNIVPTFWQ